MTEITKQSTVRTTVELSSVVRSTVDLQSVVRRTVTLTSALDEATASTEPQGFDLQEGFEGTGAPAGWQSFVGYVDFDSPSPVHTGSEAISVFTSNSSAIDQFEWAPSELDGGAQPDYIEFWYREEPQSNGTAMVVVDSQGNDVCAFATSNPDWEVLDDNGWHRHSGNDGQASDWTRIKIIFDWGAGTFTVEGEREVTGNTFTDGPNTIIGGASDVERIVNRSFQNTSGGFVSKGDDKTQWDDFRIFKA